MKSIIAIIFPFNKSPKRKPKTQLTFNGDEIKFTNTVNYLGIDLDSNLSNKSHIKKTAEKATKCMRSLHPLLSQKSKLSTKNKNIIYKSVIRPIMTYGCPIWYQSAATHIKQLQIIQNKNLKLINKLPWRFPTNQLHQLTRYPRLINFMEDMSTKFKNKCAISDYDLIGELAHGWAERWWLYSSPKSRRKSYLKQADCKFTCAKVNTAIAGYTHIYSLFGFVFIMFSF